MPTTPRESLPGLGSLEENALSAELGNLALTFMTKLPAGTEYLRSHDGYTAISAEKLRSLDPKLVSKDYFFEIRCSVSAQSERWLKTSDPCHISG